MNDWITHFVEDGGYLGIALLMVLENVFPPIPSELIMGLGGIAVAHGKMEVLPLMVAGTLGSTLGNWFWFAVGRALGYERLRPLVARYGRWLTMDWVDVEAMVRFFGRHGQWVVFAVRFSPVMRTMISLPAGLARMGQARFVVFTLAGTAVWNALLVWAGWQLGQNFGQVEAYTGPVALASMALIAAWYGWRVLTWKVREG